MSRWTGPFWTPNLAGAYAATALGLATLAFDRCWRRGGRWRLIGCPASGAIGLAACLALAATASRAGLLAALLAVGALTLSRRLHWSRMILAGGLALLCFIAWPGSGERLDGMHHDASVAARPITWKAGSRLATDHPWRGLGVHYEQALNDWYLPQPQRDALGSALNDYITRAGMHGLPIATLGLLLVCVVLFAALWPGEQRRAWPASAGAVILMVALVSGGFQHHLAFGRFQVLYPIALAAVLMASWRGAWPAWRRALILAPVPALAALGGLLFLAALDDARDWRSERIGNTVIGLPRNGTPEAVVLISDRGPRETRTALRRMQDIIGHRPIGIAAIPQTELPRSLSDLQVLRDDRRLVGIAIGNAAITALDHPDSCDRWLLIDPPGRLDGFAANDAISLLRARYRPFRSNKADGPFTSHHIAGSNAASPAGLQRGLTLLLTEDEPSESSETRPNSDTPEQVVAPEHP